MSDELVCELNLALVPEQDLAKRQIDLSRQMAKRYPAVIELNGVAPRLAFAPHLTLYQVPIKVRDMPALYGALADLATGSATFSLKAMEYGANDDEGSFELRYEPTSGLMQSQQDLIDVVNPLRGTLLLERDPAGHRLTDLIQQTGIKGDNIRHTGFDAVGDPASGGLFHPHVTINWFELGTSVDIDDPELPPVAGFTGRFVALGIYLLGPYGTCAQRVAELKLAARP